MSCSISNTSYKCLIYYFSPRKSPSRIVKSEGGSPQSGKRSFPTKESFSAEMSSKPSCSTVNSLAQTVLRKEGESTS